MSGIYAQGDGWLVFHGSAAELCEAQLPDGFREPRGRFHVVTDPPYTDNARTSRGEWNVGPEITGPLAQLVGAAESAAVILGSTRTTTSTVLAALPSWRRVLAMHQPLGTGRPPDAWKYAMQLVFVFGKNRPVTFGLRPWINLPPRSVGQKPAVKPGGHPSPLPPMVGSWLAVGLAGQLVVDPFAGAGGLPLGAYAIGARVIAGEIEERYCETIAKRLESETVSLWRQIGMRPSDASAELFDLT